MPMFKGWHNVWPPVFALIMALALWQMGIIIFDWTPYMVPSPGAVALTAIERAEPLWNASLLTLTAAVSGLSCSFCVGFVVAITFSQSRWLERCLYPYAIFLQTVPVVAIAPLIIQWVGHGFYGVVTVSFIISLFPMIANTTAGLHSPSANAHDLFDLMRANRWQKLVKLHIPSCWPHVYTGVRISSGLSVIGAIVGEFFAGFGTDEFGLGYLILFTSGQAKTDYLFACILASAGLGWSIFATVSICGRWLLTHGHYSVTAQT